MYGKRFKLFTLLGFNVYVDLSWVIIAVLVTWSLATGVFPAFVEGKDPQTYWLMGCVGALGLFGSIILHEFAHSLVARRRGMQMKGITLFVFGGVAEMSDEPPDPRSEFWVAVAGPGGSIALAVTFFLLQLMAQVGGWGEPVVGVFGYLAWVNALLVAFNLIPAFPLDGGRVLRSLLWAWKRNLRWATRIVAAMGVGFGLVLIALGIVAFLMGNFLGGFWWFVLGLFLRQAARLSYQQLMIRQALEGETVRRFMNADAITVPPATSLQTFVDDYLYRHQHKLYPVVEAERLVGCVTVNQVKNVPKSEWNTHTVGEVAGACSERNTIQADADAVQALARMNHNRASRLLVVDRDNHLAGVLTLKDLLGFLSLKVELEGP